MKVNELIKMKVCELKGRFLDFVKCQILSDEKFNIIQCLLIHWPSDLTFIYPISNIYCISPLYQVLW